MPRQVRVEYPGAIYHVMARGNHREKIVRDDEDRERFELALEEVVERTGWVLYAWTLMGNHYHLVFKTPEANLVKGMTWLQSTVTKRFNARHRQRGHLFSGRYKAVLVEENDYLTTLLNYVHLNPVRARLVKVVEGIESYRWGSLIDYGKSPSKRRSWVAVAAGMAHLGYPDQARGRRSHLEALERLVSRSRLKRAGMVAVEGAGLNATLRRGWCFGSQEFRELIQEKISDLAATNNYRMENGFQREQLRGHGEKAAQEMIEQGLAILKLAREDLNKMRKMDIKKAMLVRLLRKQTTMPLEWIAKELSMGVRSSVSRTDHNLTNELKENKKLQKVWRKMQQISS